MTYTQKNNPFNKSSNGNSNSNKIAENITDFLVPKTNLDYAASILPGGVGGSKMISKLAKTKLGSKIVSKIPGASKLFETASTATKQTKGFDFGKKSKHNWTGKKNIHMGHGPEVVQKQLNEMKSIGYNLDKIDFDASKLTPKDVKFRGSVHGRGIVEVNTPSGPQLFYKSSGTAGKKGAGTGGTTEGMWQPYGGHAGKKDWFIKDGIDSKTGKLVNQPSAPISEGYENFYNSKSFRDISGNLDRLAVQGDFQQHILKGQKLASKMNK